MADIPSIASSAQTALTNGFGKLDAAAAEIVRAGQSTPAPTDSVDVRQNITGDSDPMLTGIRDLMMAKMQISAGALLLHAYRDNRQDLVDMLRPG